MLFPALFMGTLALCSFGSAQNTDSTKSSVVSAETSMRLFLGLGTGETGDGGGIAGSIVHADKCATTYKILCTLSGWCDYGVTTYITHASNNYQITVSTPDYATGIETCSFDGTTKAVCTWTEIDTFSENHHHSTTSLTTTISDMSFWQIPITAGASKLSNLPACTSSSSSANAAAATGIKEVYKVLIVPGAAALLAGGIL